MPAWGEQPAAADGRKCVMKKNGRKLLPLLLILFLFCRPFAVQGADELQKEIALGQKVSADVEKQWERVADPALCARLNMALNRMAPYLSRPLPYEVRVVREDMVNAFSLPGGIVYFTTGMLNFLRSDAEIAAILAHELIHADKRHVMIQAARSSKISLAALVLLIASHGSAGPMILTSLAQVAVTNSYSRDLEREADKEGLKILIRAGYPPSAMVTSLEAMIHDQLKRPYVDPGVFMTHPELTERVEYIVREARDAGFPIRRKKALNLLRSSIRENDDGTICLFIDETKIWSLPRKPDSEKLLAAAAEKIDEYLQMETPPYEIQVISVGGKNALRIGPSIVAREPLPEGSEPLDAMRSAIVASLGEARQKHQGAKYLH
jgi:Zn-dependent protease with chaperone function